MINFLSTDENFLGLEEHFSNLNAAIYIQSFPYEHTSSYKKGSKYLPKAILDASHYVEFFDESLNSEIAFTKGICTLPITDFKGKVDRDAINLIKNQTNDLLKKDKFIVSLGGEHTISLGVIEAMFDKYPRLSVLQIDAHSDLRQDYEGNSLSHASVMARVADLNIPIVQLGIRAQCKEEAALIQQNPNIQTFYDFDIYNSINWLSESLSCLSDTVYISLDADGLSSDIIPSVGTLEPGGLGYYELLNVIKKVSQNKKIVGMDIVESIPIKESTISEYNLAKILYKSLGLIFENE